MKSYIKLLGVSRASLEELDEDYFDFLRQRKLQAWDKNDPRVREFRGIRVFMNTQNTPTTLTLPDSPEAAANLLITLGMQNSFILNKQIQSLEEKFIKEGGYTEKLFSKRMKYRGSAY